MMKGGHGQTNQLHDINHASLASHLLVGGAQFFTSGF